MIWMFLFLNLFASWFLPWWIFLVWALLLGWREGSAPRAFLASCLGTGLAWVMTAYYQDLKAQGFISYRLGKMFGLPHPGFSFLLVFLVVGVAAGCAAAAASLLRAPLKQQLQGKG